MTNFTKGKEYCYTSLEHYGDGAAAAAATGATLFSLAFTESLCEGANGNRMSLSFVTSAISSRSRWLSIGLSVVFHPSVCVNPRPMRTVMRT